MDFEFDKNEVYKKALSHIKTYPTTRPEAENNLYYLKEPAYFAIAGIGCHNEPTKTVRVVFQSSQYIDKCTILTYHLDNGKINYDSNPEVSLTYIDLDNIYNEYKDISKTYCED